MQFTREGLIAGLAVLAVAISVPALANANANPNAPQVVAQASAAPLLAGTPEPTEEPTSSPSDILAAAPAVGPEWNAFAKIVEAANDFIVTVKAHESVGGVEFTKTIKLSSRKPNFARCEIIAGDGTGSVAVWHGGNKVQGHEGGEHAAIIVVLPRHNKRVVDLLGHGCGDTTPDATVAYTTHNGRLTEAAGPTIDGVATDDVTWIPTPGDMVKSSKEDFFISKTTHLIVASKGYMGDALVEDTAWNIVVNPGLKFSVFDIGS